MTTAGNAGQTVPLWRAAGPAELDLVAAARWRAWPPAHGQPDFAAALSREYAAKTARQLHVPRAGAGYVTQFEVRADFLRGYPVRQAGGPGEQEYQVPAADLAGLNASIVGAIREESRYFGPVADQEFAAAASELGRELPAAWRAYLQGGSWLSRGYLPSGCFVTLVPPAEAAGMAAAMDPDADRFPGLLVLGSNGAREVIAVDARLDPAPVVLVDVTADGWEDGLEQAASIAEFTRQVEAGTFDYTWLPGPRAGHLAARRLDLRLADVHQPGDAEVVHALAELVAPDLLLQRHRDRAAGRQLLPVPAQPVPVVPGDADREAGRRLVAHLAGDVGRHDRVAGLGLQHPVHDPVRVGRVLDAEL
jgi:hypothetical protein